VLVLVVAPAALAAPLDEEVARFRPRLVDDIDQALAGAETLRDRAAAGDLDGARKAWLAARGGWERAEVFTADFIPQLDEKIDAWPNAVTGFHAIEVKLFAAGSTDVRAETEALVANLAEADTKVRQVPLGAQGLLNGIARLAYEIGGDKADGGESRFSGTSLNDMHCNIDGIDAAYATVFAAALEARDATHAASARRQIDRLRALLDVADLKSLDATALRIASEELVITLQAAAPALGLRRPTLEDKPQ
jgi:iron uptake system component EfeO